MVLCITAHHRTSVRFWLTRRWKESVFQTVGHGFPGYRKDARNRHDCWYSHACLCISNAKRRYAGISHAAAMRNRVCRKRNFSIIGNIAVGCLKIRCIWLVFHCIPLLFTRISRYDSSKYNRWYGGICIASAMWNSI